MELEKEIKLLREKVALLEKINELQDQIEQYRQLYYVPMPYPIYPTYPQPQPYNPPWYFPTWTICETDTRTTCDTVTNADCQWSYT